MGSYDTNQEYDVIIAGGGTAACVVAGRLAEADPNLSILVVEQGPNNLNDPTIINPAMHPVHLLTGSKTATFHKGNKSEALNGREPIVPCGRVLGGGSSINFMIYVRAQACDFDSWKTEGWDAKSLIPFARKLETFHYEGPDVDKSVHGYEGPVHVSDGPYRTRGMQDDYLAGVQAAGFEEVVGQQDFNTRMGFARAARTVSPEGKRQDAAHRYVHPKMTSGHYPNLHLLVEHKVTRVLFDGKRANGIECRPSEPTGQEKDKILKARKLVVVSSGVLGTPQILERSGVGNREMLENLDIPVVADVPGVGESYQDHNLMGFVYRTNLGPEETLDALHGGRLDFSQALREKNPILGWNGCDLVSKLRPTEEEVTELGADFKALWDRDFKNQTERPLMLLAPVSFCMADPMIISDSMGSAKYQYISNACYTAYPYSRGDIHIVSRDASEPASLNPGFLTHPADLKKLIWAYKKQREIIRRTNHFVAEAPFAQPKFPAGSKAGLILEHPVGGGGYKSQRERQDLPPIEYTDEDDAAIEEYIREKMQSTWHSLGSCKMAPREEGGVVDKWLNVHGTECLKIADLSICPENVAANTNNTALIVGEKAAWIIGRELGLSIPV